MLTWLKIAVRNLIKNKRRSSSTILAIALGYAAINVFGGFTYYVFESLEETFIYLQGNGHISVFKKGYLEGKKLDPSKYLLSEHEVNVIKDKASALADTLLTTSQLNITGLLSNGETSTIFAGFGHVPSESAAIKSHSNSIIGKKDYYTGKPLRDDVPHGVGLSSGLAKLLDLHMDSDAIIMAPTVDGQINALDVQVYQLFEASSELLNDILLSVPLEFAQLLYDTRSVDHVNILLKDDQYIDAVMQELSTELSRAGLEVDIRTWDQLSNFYVKVKQMFDIIFLFVFVIVMTIVVMSVVNTISMAIIERTREIGTLRALGMKRWKLIQLFALESGLLGLCGSLIGVIFTVIVWSVIVITEPTWIPPQFSTEVPLEIHLVPDYLLLTMAFLLGLSVIVAIPPANRAVCRQIVDALGHV